MNKYLVIRIALSAAVLGGVGFGLYKLYEAKQEPKQVIDISEKYKKKPVEEELEVVEPEVVEDDETVSQGTNSEPTVTIEPEEEEDDNGYDNTYEEYDDHGWS